jgi:hypothetical protein
VPTDPFVPPDPADRPRQQQNLPPGTALPPARHWHARRPGDLRGDQPRGRLFGTPGPNVGYAYTLAERSQDRLRLAAHERVDDAVPVVAEIAGKRATLFRRAPVIRDVDVAVALLGYDGSADDDFAQVRALLVHGAGHDYARRRSIVDTVPEQLLRLAPEALAEGIAEWRSVTRSRLFPELGRRTG